MHICICTFVVALIAKSCPTLFRPRGLKPLRLLCPLDYPGKNTRGSCHALLQGIFLTQGLNPCLLRWIIYHWITRETYICTYQIRSDQISRSVVSHSLRLHESQHARPPCPSPTPGVHWDSCPSMFPAAQLMMTLNWKQPNVHRQWNEWINDSILKWHKNLCNNLYLINITSERSQTQWANLIDAVWSQERSPYWDWVRIRSVSAVHHFWTSVDIM